MDNRERAMDGHALIISAMLMDYMAQFSPESPLRSTMAAAATLIIAQRELLEEKRKETAVRFNRINQLQHAVDLAATALK